LPDRLFGLDGLGIPREKNHPMKFPALLSTSAAALCLALSIWLFFASLGDQSLQSDLQKRQTTLQTHQQDFQIAQQQLQSQQQQIQTANTLAEKVGPAVVTDLVTLAKTNKNDKIKKLLTKYGVSTEDAPAASPKPAAAATPAPKP
jgi:hypothetical protein